MVLSAVCNNQSYTYIRRLNTCIRRNVAMMTFDDARADCQADGGDLLMVKNNDVRLYLKDIMLAVTGCVEFSMFGIAAICIVVIALSQINFCDILYSQMCISFVHCFRFRFKLLSKTKCVLIC